MSKKALRNIDHQGRIALPSHFRHALTLVPGNVVEVTLEDDNTIRIRPTEERCYICGDSVEGKDRAEVRTGPEKKFVCCKCAQAIIGYVEKE